MKIDEVVFFCIRLAIFWNSFPLDNLKLVTDLGFCNRDGWVSHNANSNLMQVHQSSFKIF